MSDITQVITNLKMNLNSLPVKPLEVKHEEVDSNPVVRFIYPGSNGVCWVDILPVIKKYVENEPTDISLHKPTHYNSYYFEEIVIPISKLSLRNV